MRRPIGQRDPATGRTETDQAGLLDDIETFIRSDFGCAIITNGRMPGLTFVEC